MSRHVKVSSKMSIRPTRVIFSQTYQDGVLPCRVRVVAWRVSVRGRGTGSGPWPCPLQQHSPLCPGARWPPAGHAQAREPEKKR